MGSLRFFLACLLVRWQRGGFDCIREWDNIPVSNLLLKGFHSLLTLSIKTLLLIWFISEKTVQKLQGALLGGFCRLFGLLVRKLKLNFHVCGIHFERDCCCCDSSSYNATQNSWAEWNMHVFPGKLLLGTTGKLSHIGRLMVEFCLIIVKASWKNNYNRWKSLATDFEIRWGLMPGLPVFISFR